MESSADQLIHVLADEVIDQIAAGEVVERPASVVKELVENAIDAGAKRVQVTIEGGGLKSISVSDDGRGMSPADARLSLMRHATSKLARAQDLAAIRTLGFRGEALSSISDLALQARFASRARSECRLAPLSTCVTCSSTRRPAGASCARRRLSRPMWSRRPCARFWALAGAA